MSKITTLLSILKAKESPSDHELYLIKRAEWVCGFLKWIPWIRMIALVNSLSMYAWNKKSDIDLFIVSAPWRLWLVRAFSTLIVKLLWVRRYKENIEWLVCLSFFATTHGLDFQKIAIERDIYLATWIAHLKPIYTIQGTYETLIQKNEWIYEVDAPSATELKKSLKDAKVFLQSDKQPVLVQIWEWLLYPLWSILDPVIKSIFIKRTRKSYIAAGKPWGVIISDDILKFHPDDRREILRDEVEERLKCL